MTGRNEVGAPPTPWVFASPHSGRDLPPDMRPAPGLSRRSLRSAEDALVDRLIEGADARGVAVLCGAVSRAYVDLNRGPDELDPMLMDEASGGAAPSPRAAAGYGVVPRLTGDGRPLYARRLTRKEVERRVAEHHGRYHARLADLMEAARRAHGRAVLVDWHSMPPGAAGAARVVIGDRHGESCSPALSARLAGLFEAEGWPVALNRPYAGGWSTQTWGRPDEGFEAVQIELDRGLYLDASGAAGPGWARCKAGVERVIAALVTGS